MGVEVGHQIARERKQERLAERGRAAAESVKTGNKRFIKRLGRIILGRKSEPDLQRKVGQYAEVRALDSRRVFGDSKLGAAYRTKETYCRNPDMFIDQAVDYSAYRARLTEGPYGISTEIFEHAVTVDPYIVLSDAGTWAQITRAHDQALTAAAEINPSSVSV